MVIEGVAEHSNLSRLSVFGIDIDNITMQQAINWIINRSKREGKSVVSFVNAHNLNQVVTKSEYRRSILRSDLILPDGTGVKIASVMNGVNLKENVNGTDMLPLLCDAISSEAIPVYLLGAKQGVAEAMARKLKIQYKNLNVVGCEHGYFPKQETGDVIARINRSGAKILLVAMGTPHQEIWIDRFKLILQPTVIIGVGGLFDFYSGRIPRAPIWFRDWGCEWVWRLLQEPERMWRRYLLGNPLFLFRIFLMTLKRGSRDVKYN